MSMFYFHISPKLFLFSSRSLLNVGVVAALRRPLIVSGPGIPAGPLLSLRAEIFGVVCCNTFIKKQLCYIICNNHKYIVAIGICFEYKINRVMKPFYINNSATLLVNFYENLLNHHHLTKINKLFII